MWYGNWARFRFMSVWLNCAMCQISCNRHLKVGSTHCNWHDSGASVETRCIVGGGLEVGCRELRPGGMINSTSLGLTQCSLLSGLALLPISWQGPLTGVVGENRSTHPPRPPSSRPFEREAKRWSWGEYLLPSNTTSILQTFLSKRRQALHFDLAGFETSSPLLESWL